MMPHEEITNRIAIVLQESEMFNLTISENITLMKEVDEVFYKCN